MALFWICLIVLMISLAWGLLTTTALYDRLGADADADPDRLVRESW